jgi:hypothetical protein
MWTLCDVSCREFGTVPFFHQFQLILSRADLSKAVTLSHFVQRTIRQLSPLGGVHQKTVVVLKYRDLTCTRTYL